MQKFDSLTRLLFSGLLSWCLTRGYSDGPFVDGKLILKPKDTTVPQPTGKTYDQQKNAGTPRYHASTLPTFTLSGIFMRPGFIHTSVGVLQRRRSVLLVLVGRTWCFSVTR